MYKLQTAKMNKSYKGFTLIELLIVIAVLGILAVAVLAAINPIEQINRSRDTGSRSDAEQLIGAIDRFYASKGYYPWQLGATDAEVLPQSWTAIDSGWDDGATPVLLNLSQAGTQEVKKSFTDRITTAGYNTLYVYMNGAQGDSYYICFKPLSGSFNDDAMKRCSTVAGLTDFPDEACQGSAVPPLYYSCLP
jgi:prepilin-type N-terminal cleavage/methylation domain-containing protein